MSQCQLLFFQNRERMSNLPSESSFAQILNRTQQNLNRINQRYAPSSGLSTVNQNVPSRYFSKREPSTSDFSVVSSNYPVGKENDRFGKNTSSNLIKPQFSTSQSQQTQPSNPPYQPNRDIIQELCDRLVLLEARMNEDTLNTRKVEQLQKLVQQHESLHITQQQEIKDLQRTLQQTQSRVATLETFVDTIRLESETNRLQSHKLELWMKDTELFRESSERITNTLRREVSDIKQQHIEMKDRLYQTVNHQEMDTLKDRVHLIAQQSITQSILAYTEKHEARMKRVERDLALLKMNQSAAVLKELQVSTQQVILQKAGLDTMRGRDEEGEVGDLGEEGEDEDIDKKDTFIDGDNNSNEYQATINTKSNNSRKPLERATQQLQEQILSNQIELTSEAVLKALEMPTPSEILIEGIVSKHMLSFQEQILRSLSKSLEQTMTMKMQQEEKKLIYQLQEILYSVGMMESISPLLSFSATTNSATPSLSTTTTAAPNHSNNSNNSLFNFQAGDALNNNTNNTNNITINASSSSSSIDSQKHLNHVRQELQKKIIEGRK
jgi:hypothetical protein